MVDETQDRWEREKKQVERKLLAHIAELAGESASATDGEEASYFAHAAESLSQVLVDLRAMG